MPPPSPTTSTSTTSVSFRPALTPGIHDDDLKDAKLNFEWESGENKDVSDKFLSRRLNQSMETPLQKQLAKGTLLACISSRPGQSGRCDGYILEGSELDFYQRKMIKKKSK